MNPTVLIVDDKEAARVLAKDYIGNTWSHLEADSSASCLATLRSHAVDAVVLDLNIPGVKDFGLLTTVRQKYPSLPVLMLTSFGDFQKAVQATKLGASDFIPKEQAELLLKPSLDRIFKSRQDSDLSDAYKDALNVKYETFIPDHPLYSAVYAEGERLAKSDLSYLLLGETGTGKDVLAQHVHRCSGRSGAFVRVDCGELDAHFLRSELFGHEKGAYTGADLSRIGKIELANRGTLFLDEIGNMSLDIQSKFLTVLEKKSFQRLGGNDAISVEFRVIAATNMDLKKAIAAGKFREDLYYRLNEIELVLPPLRETPEAIPQFIQHFLSALNKTHHSQFNLDLMTLGKYLSHLWPGNIRELKAHLKRDFFRSQFSSDPTGIASPPETNPNMTSAIQVIEKMNIEQMLKAHDGNVSQAAKAMNLKRQTLAYKVKKFGLEAI